MAWPPTITLEWSPTTGPYQSPSYSDVSSYLMRGETFRGRNRELARSEPGTFRADLDNQTRQWDPVNNTNVKPMRRFRMSVTFNAVTYRIFTGFAERFPQPWDGDNTYSITPVECVDGFDTLGNTYLPAATYPEELSSARIGRVLTAAGWPIGDRTIDTGVEIVPAATIAEGQTTALAHIQDVVDTEYGVCFVNGAGNFIFHTRRRRQNPTYTASSATFGDDLVASELFIDVLENSFDRDDIINAAAVTASGGTAQTASDSTSQTSYGLRSASVSTSHNSDALALTMADALIYYRKDPALRIDTLTFRTIKTENMFTQAMTREVGDVITVTRRPPGGGSAITKVLTIESIRHRFEPATIWETTWQLSPANQTAFWKLGNATYGVNGSTTILGW